MGHGITLGGTGLVLEALEIMAKVEREREIEARRDDEIAESIKVTMKALKDFFGIKSGSVRGRLKSVGAEFGHIVSRNITDSNDPEVILEEIATFWNGHGLGEMEILEKNPYIFTVRNCYDCLAASGGEMLCGFKEGFINAVLSDRTGGIGDVSETECCGSGAENCTFRVMAFQRPVATAS